MRRKLISPKPTTVVPATRLAWWAAFLTTLVLVLGLSVVRSAKAAVLPPVGPVNVPGIVEPDEDEDGEEEDGEAEECEAAEAAETAETAEEGEEDEAGCDEEVDSGPPPACFLSSADAAVSTDLVHGKVRLAVRYEGTPATVAVDYALRGGRGGLNFEGNQEHFGASGVFRTSQSLTEAEAKRVAAAKSFTVTVRPLNSPRSCNSYLDQHLSVRHAAPGGSLWVDSESTFRRARRH
jgi:hypothetical protein